MEDSHLKNALDELDKALEKANAPVTRSAPSEEEPWPDEETLDEDAGSDVPESEKVKKAKKIRKADRRMNDFQAFALKALLFVLVVYVLFGHIIGVATAPNRDMFPRIDNGDLLMYYRLDKEPKAQDIIVFVKNDTRYVGRVVAVQGDSIEITENGGLIINGNSMLESNIFYETYPLEGFVEYPLTLGEGECFVLMDGRRGAEDSRYFGPVKYEELLGTVFTVIRRNNL